MTFNHEEHQEILHRRVRKERREIKQDAGSNLQDTKTKKAEQKKVKNPIIIGSFLRMFGYWTYKARRVKRPVSKEFVKFLRDEEKLKFKIYFPKRNYHEK